MKLQHHLLAGALLAATTVLAASANANIIRVRTGLPGLADLGDLGPIGDDASPIIGGGPVSSHPAVAALVSFDANDNPLSICSGTLIAQSLILTAAHCIDNVEGNEVGYLVYFGQDVVTALETGTEPGYIGHTFAATVQAHPLWDRNQLEAGNDIALMTLQAPGPVAPLPIRSTPLSAAEVGASLELIGWGKTSGEAQDAGQKRGVLSQLRGVEAGLIQVGAGGTNICNGDSGGPAFMTIAGVQVIAGVASFGELGCGGPSFSTRVDRQIAFITGSGGPGPGPGGGGTGSFGDLCADGSECASGVCATDGESDPICSQLCDATTNCPSGFDCAPVNTTTSVCVPGDEGGTEGGGGGREGGGCSVGGGGVGGTPIAIFFAVLLAVRRRRR